MSKYATIHFPSEDEEHLIPHDLISHSPTLDRLVQASHDHSTSIQHVASSAFSDLMDYLLHPHAELDLNRTNQILETAVKLDFPEAEERLKKLVKANLFKTKRF